MAGTAAKPTDRRQPHSCILEVPARANQQTSYSQVARYAYSSVLLMMRRAPVVADIAAFRVCCMHVRHTEFTAAHVRLLGRCYQEPVMFMHGQQVGSDHHARAG